MSRTNDDEIMSRKLSIVDMTAANGAATRTPANHGISIKFVNTLAISGIMRSESVSQPGIRTLAQQKMMTIGK